MLLSVVVPAYNEAEALPALLAVLRPVLDGIGCDYELVFVDDGSRDATGKLLDAEAAADRRVKVLHLSRNFGHQAAITAGLDYASGDAVAVMDADLQDPPALLPEMVELYRRGYDVVSARRVARDGDGPFKRATAAAFYWLMRWAVDGRLEPQVGDYRLFSRGAVGVLRGFREQHRFLRGLVAWTGLREVVLPFRRAPRAAGETKYPLRKMLRLAWTAVSSFSGLPLRLTLSAGLALAAAGLGVCGYALFARTTADAPGAAWVALAGLQAVLTGAVLAAVGLLGDYVARVYEEVKGRPLYVLAATANVDRGVPPPARAAVLPERPTPTPVVVVAERPAPAPAANGLAAAGACRVNGA